MNAPPTDIVERAELEPGGEYSFAHILEKLEGIDPSELALALARLQNEGRIRRVIRVESPTELGGIEDYERLEDVPEELYDWRADEVIRVDPDDLRVVFQVPEDE